MPQTSVTSRTGSNEHRINLIWLVLHVELSSQSDNHSSDTPTSCVAAQGRQFEYLLYFEEVVTRKPCFSFKKYFPPVLWCMFTFFGFEHKIFLHPVDRT
jgi:hypothetical protein